MSSRKQIGNTLTITTMDDPVSVQAQYAPNANPTSGQIHTVWQEGDLYMRTRESDESAWSSWHRIVGESGGETNYMFALSAYKVSQDGTSATPPSDISSNDWQDAPLPTTTQLPFLWEKVQKKDGSGNNVGNPSYIRITGEEGKGYKATVYRDNFTLGQWNTYGTIGHVESWNYTESSRNGCGVGDLFLVVGKATDDSSYHKLTYRCDNSSGNLHGTCVEHQVTNDGTSPYFADLNNEMDAIQCKHDGGVITAQTVSTVISMWKGSAVEAFVIDNIYRNGTQLTWGNTSNGVKASKSGSTVSIEFGTNASIANIDDFKITIHSYNDNTVTRELHFTINGVRANAIYRLVPSHSQIVKKKDGTYEPSVNITCSVEKNENGSTSTPSSSEYTLEKSVNGGSYEAYSATAPSSITSDLKFRLKVGGVVVDLETIPLVSDGDKGNTGDSAPNAFANPAQISIPCYSNGNVKAQKITSVTFSLKVGTNTATVTSCAYGTKPTGVTVQGQAANAVTITVGTSATASGLSAGVTFTVTGTYGGKTYSANVTVALIGSVQGEQGTQGQRGMVGRFFYYATEWDATDNSQVWSATDAEAPYFKVGSSYYVYIGENNFTDKTMYWINANYGAPSPNNANFKIMYNEWKYIITEAIFGSYAHLGSFIINGDWMISQHGTVNGSASTNYTAFDPQHPNDNTGSNFIPNFAVDGLNGKTYQNDAYVRGEITATSGKIGCDAQGNGGWMINYHKLTNGTTGASGVLMLSTDDQTGTINNTQYPDLRMMMGNKFGIRKDGSLIANDGNFTGTIHATGGDITGNDFVVKSTDANEPRQIIIRPYDTNWGASIIGKQGNNQLFSLGISLVSGTYTPTLLMGNNNFHVKITDELIEQKSGDGYTISQGSVFGSNNGGGIKISTTSGDDVKFGITSNGLVFVQSDRWPVVNSASDLSSIPVGSVCAMAAQALGSYSIRTLAIRVS